MTKHWRHQFWTRVVLCAAALPLALALPSSADAQSKKRAREAAAAAAAAAVPAPPPAPTPPNAAPWQAALVEQTDGPMRSFYFYRSGPLWVSADGVPNAAANALLELVRTAQLDGIEPNMIGSAEVTAAFAALPQDASPAARARAEVAMSRTFISYVRALRDTTSAQMFYEHDQLRPFVPEPYTVLDEAAGAPSLAAYVREMKWMHPLYAQLRRSLIAGEPANSSIAHVAKANLERLRALPDKPGDRYVLIDAASARMWMYENGRPVDSMKVVVGKAETQTPVMAGYIRYAVFNPYWNVPTDLIRKTIARRARAQGQGYLTRGRYQVVSDWTADAEVLPSAGIDWRAVESGELDVKVRQLPGGANAMGKMKFEFPNPQGIYLHDTPELALMLKDDRQLSNGCIRLEDAARFGRWLMGGALPEVGKDPEQLVNVPTPVPIYVTYLTLDLASDQLAVVGDPYALDARSGPSGVVLAH